MKTAPVCMIGYLSEWHTPFMAQFEHPQAQPPLPDFLFLISFTRTNAKMETTINKTMIVGAFIEPPFYS